MASLVDICVSAAINLLSAIAFLTAFAILRLQPINDRVYFPKWYLKGMRGSPTSSRTAVSKFVNLDYSSYLRFLDWMPAALHMPEPELIDHAGLDSAVYIRIYLLGLKIFVPIAILALGSLIPVNWTGRTSDASKSKEFSNIDKLSISNVPDGSKREYKIIAGMRLRFLAAERRRPDQFTVLVRNVPPDPDESVSEHIEHFFCVNHPDHYLLHRVVYNANKLASIVAKKRALLNWSIYYENKYERNPSQRPVTRTGMLGLFGKKVDAINHYTSLIDALSKQEEEERQKVINDPEAIVPAAFVSFKTRWGTAVCAQTQQTSNPTVWLTEWAPEPRDVYWDNLAIPYLDLNLRKLLMNVAMFFLTFFFMIPIALVQSLANVEVIEKVFPFLKPIIYK
ncbi:hypothetical protein PIB30_066129 [Stylosanthes scabra]|uniref:Uncharacterized protein n=1 Tax=Stylosanthes scabra TaxID=79078 RepID=A0ABU6XN54_9FABA|nr:hypothetical protein [Stylosanthes scabra]